MLKCRRKLGKLSVSSGGKLRYLQNNFQSLPQKERNARKGKWSTEFKFKISTAQIEYRNPGLAVEKMSEVGKNVEVSGSS